MSLSIAAPKPCGAFFPSKGIAGSKGSRSSSPTARRPTERLSKLTWDMRLTSWIGFMPCAGSRPDSSRCAKRIQRIGDKGERPAFDPSIFRSTLSPAHAPRPSQRRTVRPSHRHRLSGPGAVARVALGADALYGVYKGKTEAEATTRIEEFVHSVLSCRCPSSRPCSRCCQVAARDSRLPPQEPRHE